MCNLLVGIKKEPKEYEEMRELTHIQIPQLKTQRNGCGAIAISENGKAEVKRSLSDYDSVFEWMDDKMEGAKLFAIHTRIASSGGINEDNVHFFEDRGIYIAHNGWLRDIPTTKHIGFKSDKEVLKADKDGKKILAEMERCYKILEGCSDCSWYKQHKYSTCKKHTGEENRINKLIDEVDVLLDYAGLDGHNENVVQTGYSDSVYYHKGYGEVDTLTFLKSIERPLSKESIEKAVRTTKFLGMAFIYDTNEKKAWVVIKDKTVHVAIRDGYIELFSYDPTLSTTETYEEEINGIPIEYKKTHDVLYKDEVVTVEDGVYPITGWLKEDKPKE